MIQKIKAYLVDKVHEHQLKQAPAHKAVHPAKEFWYHQGAIEALEALDAALPRLTFPEPPAQGQCKHPYVHPKGTCIRCDALATIFPSLSDSRQHLVVPRLFIVALLDFRRHAKAALRFELADQIRALLESIGYDVLAQDKQDGPPIKLSESDSGA